MTENFYSEFSSRVNRQLKQNLNSYHNLVYAKQYKIYLK